ncbi:hypothetical protein M413DRAFT_28273 [Hebeloma cylindrosporum]|uniref:Uncharacterized protein n=1 Tax=Hebeloma cylindrosporum TaxID=76867 RepID=A0A0C3CA19_HEBCY|nr:hypothetical protein M413DRAFT_28273 [Hebeloma cylindrosporum h7]
MARRVNPEEVDDWLNFYVNIFIDQDMIMHYFGGGVGHLKNTPPQQARLDADPGDLNSEEIEVDEDEGEVHGNVAREGLCDVIMNNRELEVADDDEEAGREDNDEDDEDDDNDENDDDNDEENEDEDEGLGRGGEDDDDDKEGDYGYSSP